MAPLMSRATSSCFWNSCAITAGITLLKKPNCSRLLISHIKLPLFCCFVQLRGPGNREGPWQGRRPSQKPRPTSAQAHVRAWSNKAPTKRVGGLLSRSCGSGQQSSVLLQQVPRKDGLKGLQCITIRLAERKGALKQLCLPGARASLADSNATIKDTETGEVGEPYFYNKVKQICAFIPQTHE